jgi:hypothetical protein
MLFSSLSSFRTGIDLIKALVNRLSPWVQFVYSTHCIQRVLPLETGRLNDLLLRYRCQEWISLRTIYVGQLQELRSLLGTDFASNNLYIFSWRWEITCNEIASVWLTRILGWGFCLRDTTLTSLVVWQCFTFYRFLLRCTALHLFTPIIVGLCSPFSLLFSLDCVPFLC